MANFPTEACEDLLACPSQHVASATGAAEIRFLQAQMVGARRNLALAFQKIMDDLKTSLLLCNLGSCLSAGRIEAFTKLLDQRFGVVSHTAVSTLDT